MELHINLAGRKDLSGEIYRQLRRAILEGRLRSGEVLPPTRELARRLSVARTTVSVAYDRLAAEGFTSSRVGSGTFVTDNGATLSRHSTKHQADGALQPRPIWNSIPLALTFARSAQFDFRSGLPDVSLFPHEKWRRLISRALRSEALRGGIYTEPEGYAPLREAIARYVGVARGMEISPDHVTVVNGTQQGIDLVARTLLAPSDRVALEDPGYPLVRRLMESLDLRIASVPVDQSGIAVDALPRTTRLVYVTPSHQYPLGVSMDLRRRRALLEWADRHNAAIIEDDYDSEFRFRDRPIEPLKTLDRTGRVIYIGSFSKTILPTIRLGFVVAPPSLSAAMRRAKQLTDWHTAMPLQIALAEFIENGEFSRHVRKMREAYRIRRGLILDILTKEFSEYLEIVPSIAGLHIAAFARTASLEDISAIVREASEIGVGVQQLSMFTAYQPSRAGILLGYGAISTTHIPEGLQRLRSCFSRRGSISVA